MPSISFLSRTQFGTAVVLIALSFGLATPGQAQMGSPPFWKDQTKTKPTQKPATQPKKPYLEPMQDRPQYGQGGTPNAPSRDGRGWQNEAPYAGTARPGVSGRGVRSAPLSELDRGVDSNSLGPVMAGAGVGGGAALPYDLWQGVTVRQVEQLIAALTIPPRSTAVHDLWTRVITSNAKPPRPGDATVPFPPCSLKPYFDPAC